MRLKMFIALVAVMLVVCMILFAKLLIITYNNDLEVLPYEQVQLSVTPMETNYTKETAKQAIDKLYNTKHKYNETKVAKGTTGNAQVFTRVVNIDPNLTVHEYIITYAHELTHVKYQTADETFTAYKTFEVLYESGDEELKYHATKYASAVIAGAYEYTDYDCGYYMLKYFSDHNVEIHTSAKI